MEEVPAAIKKKTGRKVPGVDVIDADMFKVDPKLTAG